MVKPLCIDLFCGLGGWAEGFLAEGYRVVGFDIESRPYPGQLVIQDVLTIHGAQFRNAACIVASPPCQAYSYMAMPWKRAKALAAWYREECFLDDTYPSRIKGLNALFDACFRIQREASEAAGREIPMVVENVKGAQVWVGRARWHYGSFYLWGDVPALMPFTSGRKSKLPPGNNRERRWEDRPIARLGDATKNEGGSWFNQAHNTESGHGQNLDGRLNGSARAQASAKIAMIPFPLAQHIAHVFKPDVTISTRTTHP